jgi:vacuolar-type H+-ATPase catalytic subunit A/Vma1
MPPRKTQQVLESWYSNDDGSDAHSGDDRAPGLAVVPAVSLASGSLSNPVQYMLHHHMLCRRYNDGITYGASLAL